MTLCHTTSGDASGVQKERETAGVELGKPVVSDICSCGDWYWSTQNRLLCHTIYCTFMLLRYV